MKGNKIQNSGSFYSEAPMKHSGKAKPTVKKAGKGGDLRSSKSGGGEAYRAGKEKAK